MNYENEFRSHMATFGLAPDDILGDGKLHKFGKNGHGWYVLHIDADGSGGAFGSWSQGPEKETWCSFTNDANADPEKMAKVMAKIEESKRQHEAAKLERAKKAEADSARIWADGEPLRPGHPYLVKKQVPGKGLKMERGTNRLMVPMYASGKKLIGIQYISEDGEKRFIPGCAKKGSCSIIRGELNDRIYVVEGYATGASVNMATNRTVFVAFDSGNLFPICEHIRTKTSAPIIICADDDLWTVRKDGTPYNSGRISALKCFNELGCAVAFPLFKDTDQRPTDFNDLMCAEGVVRVKELTCDPYANRQEQIAKQVERWVTSAGGKFTTNVIDRELGIKPEEIAFRDEAILSLLRSGVLEQDDTHRNIYRSRDRTVNVLDLKEIKEDKSISFWMPFGLGEVVCLSPRNIVMVAGEQNSGKTTWALETLRENISMYKGSGKKFYYLTSEMSAEELKSNVLRFGRLPEFDGCTFIDRQFEPYDLIKGNQDMQDGIVFIDFLETRGGEYSKTVSEVQKIYDSMGKGIAVVLVQKQPGKEWGKGGSGMLEKPRFALNLEKRFKSDSGTVCVSKIAKCKSVYPGTINPDGKGLYYLVNEKGATAITDWGILTDKIKDDTDAIMKAQLGVREFQGPVINMEAIENVRR